MRRSSPWGVKVNRIEIKDIVPPANLVQSMGRQMQAEREKRAEILEAEGQRQSAILKAEGQKQAQILEAEGRREAAFRDAEGARAARRRPRRRRPRWSARRSRSGDVASLNYFVAQKYIEAFGKLATSPNQKVLIVPMEATGVLGSLAGIGEIAQGDVRRRRRWGDGGRGGRQDRSADAAQAERPGRLHHPRLYAAGLSEQPHVDRFSYALGKWNWLILAAVFFVIELVAPGAFMLWLGLSALLVGIVSLLVDWPWQYQLVAFAIFALASIPLWRRFARGSRKPGDQPFLNRRARCLHRPRVHAGKADRGGQRHRADRRHDLAAVGTRLPRRQPRQGRARGCGDPGGGGGLSLGHARAQQIVQMHDADRRAVADHEHGRDLR